MKGVPSKLKVKFTGWLRGEILLFKDDWQEHFDGHSNPRNVGGGTAKRHDGSGCEHLTVIFYDLYSDSRSFSTIHEKLDFIDEELGLLTPGYDGPISYDKVPSSL